MKRRRVAGSRSASNSEARLKLPKLALDVLGLDGRICWIAEFPRAGSINLLNEALKIEHLSTPGGKRTQTQSLNCRVYLRAEVPGCNKLPISMYSGIIH